MYQSCFKVIPKSLVIILSRNKKLKMEELFSEPTKVLLRNLYKHLDKVNRQIEILKKAKEEIVERINLLEKEN
jgi:hypothetical protein